MSWIDITPQWDATHPHLRPLERYLPLADDDHGTCPHCAGKTVRVLACVRIGEDWQDATAIDYCAACDRFTLPDALADSQVTAVEARLWFNEPTVLILEPTTRCNFNCWYCIGRHMKQEDIKAENFAKILDNFPSVKTIILTGEGESLMHKDFFTMAHMAKDRGIWVWIVSNGSAFSQSVVKKMCEAEIAYVGISIDSVDPATFAASRLDGDLPKIWQGIERLCRYRDDNGYRYPRIGVRGTLFSHTANEMPAIVEEAKRHGVDIIEWFQPLNPKQTYISAYPEEKLSELDQLDNVSAAIRRDSEAANRTLQPLDDFLAAEGIEHFAACVGSNGLRKNCNEQYINAMVSADVTPCCMVKMPIDIKWNLLDHSIEDILIEPSYQNTRFNLWNGLFPNYCEGCWKTR